jgi:hypothetical protein
VAPLVLCPTAKTTAGETGETKENRDREIGNRDSDYFNREIGTATILIEEDMRNRRLLVLRPAPLVFIHHQGIKYS